MTQTGSDVRRPTRRGRRRGSTAITAVGVTLLLVGIGCLGWVGYQYVGSNLIAERAFSQGNTTLRRQWDADPPSGRATPGAETEAAAKVPGSAIALLRIPAFGDDYEVPILSGTSLDILDRGVGHYTSTALPGQIGNFAIAGHRVTHGEPFKRLLELERGDQVVVETRSAIYTYALDEPPRNVTVRDTATWVLDPVPGKEGVRPTSALITLTTCQDLFRSPDRSVGFGHLVSTKNKA